MTQAPQCLSLGSYDNTPQTHSEEFVPFLEVERFRTKLLGEDSHPALRWQLCPVCLHLVGSRVQGEYRTFLPSHEQLYSPDIITQGSPLLIPSCWESRVQRACLRGAFTP